MRIIARQRKDNKSKSKGKSKGKGRQGRAGQDRIARRTRTL